MKAHEMHVGITWMKARIKEIFWWPGWWKDADDFIRSFGEWEMTERTQRTISPPLLSVKLPRNPWGRIAMDFKGPLNEGPHKFLFVVVDYYSRCPEVVGITSMRSAIVIEALYEMFNRMGYPKRIVTDNGTSLISKNVMNFLTERKIELKKVSLYARVKTG